MDVEVEIVEYPKIHYRKLAIVTVSVVVVAFLTFLGSKAYMLTKDIFVARSSGSSQVNTLLRGDNPRAITNPNERRVNILLLGMGGENHPGGTLTDSIIIASIDPYNKGVSLLSLPRDLYVPVGKFGSDKINALYTIGEEYYGENNEKEIFEFIKKSIGDVIGVPIHYFAQINFDGFTTFIDRIGGLEINVEESLYDPYYPSSSMDSYEEFQIDAGTQVLDGETALKYVRSRHTTSDFDRARRQQQVLLAVKEKILGEGTLMSIKRITQLFGSLAGNVKTDLRFDELEFLAKAGQNIEPSNIHMKVIDDAEDGLVYADQYDDMYVLVPNDETFDEMRNFVQQYFKDPLIVQENAAIAVRNGTMHSGAAQEFANQLITLGYRVVDVGNADKRDYATTFIYDYSGGKKTNTINFLRSKLNGAPVVNLDNGLEDWDIEIIVGQDYRSNL